MSHIAHLVTVSQNQSHSSYWIFTRRSQTKDVFGDGTSSMSLAGRKPKEPTWRSDIIWDTAMTFALPAAVHLHFIFLQNWKIQKKSLSRVGTCQRRRHITECDWSQWSREILSCRLCLPPQIFFGVKTNNCLSREPFNNIMCMLVVFVIPKYKKQVSKGRGSRQQEGEGGCEQNDPNWTRNEQNTVNWTPVQIWMNHAICY